MHSLTVERNKESFRIGRCDTSQHHQEEQAKEEYKRKDRVPLKGCIHFLHYFPPSVTEEKPKNMKKASKGNTSLWRLPIGIFWQLQFIGSLRDARLAVNNAFQTNRSNRERRGK
jgi:hypothetical protein